MPTYLLDSMVIVDFQSAGALPALAAASRRFPLAIAEHVHGEMTIPKPNAAQTAIERARNARRVLDTGSFEILSMLPASLEYALFLRLTGGVARTHDNGEAASIAVAVGRTHLVFVTGDRNGTLSALNELHSAGERVMRVPVFVRRLVEEGALTPDQARSVGPRAVSHGVEPSWWTAWLASLPV